MQAQKRSKVVYSCGQAEIMTAKNSRYDDKPMLRLLELYVLWAIHQISDEDAQRLVDMTPKLQTALHAQGSWQEVIASAMELPANMPELIKDMWAKNTAIAKKAGVTLLPQEFAEMFVDANLR